MWMLTWLCALPRPPPPPPQGRNKVIQHDGKGGMGDADHGDSTETPHRGRLSVFGASWQENGQGTVVMFESFSSMV